MKYRLSNTQRKALLVRGEQLRIALPLPLDWPEDAPPEQLTRFFIEHLPEVTPEQLRDVTETELCVRPYHHKATEPPTMLPIVPREVWHMVAGVVIGTLVHPPTPRHINPGVQWPGDIRHMLPEAPTGEAQPSSRIVPIRTEDAGEWTIRHTPEQVSIFDQHGEERGRYKPDVGTLATHLAIALSKQGATS